MLFKVFLVFIYPMLCFSADSPPSSKSTEKLEITVFNVGQGNCVSVNCSQDNALLVDCGSSEYREDNRRGVPKVALDDIKTKILDLSKIKPITVVVSHLDKDHYNWLPKIFVTNESFIRINKVIIVGDEDALKQEAKKKGSKKKFLDWIKEIRAHGKDVIFYKDFNSAELSGQLPACGTGRGEHKSPQILTFNVCRKLGFKHPECESPDDTSANSL